MELWKQLPLLRVLVFFLAGIVLHEYAKWFTPFLPPPEWITGFLLLSLLGALVLHQRQKKALAVDLCLVLFLILAGAMLARQQVRPVLTEPTDAILVGTVETLNINEKGWWRITVLIHEATTQEGAPRLEGTKLLLTSGDSCLANLIAGDRMRLQARLQTLPFNTNPHAFDYGRYLQRRGYSTQAFLSAGDWEQLQLSPAILLALPWEFNRWCRSILAQNHLEPEALALIQALLLGNRDELDRELNQGFIKSGAIHLLAVSGLHTGIIYLLAGGFLALFLRPSHPLSVILLIVILATYAVITGLAPSVVRAVLMLSLLQVGKLSHRPINKYNLLCASALLQLLWNPLLIYHAGFWLSHLAVVGILAFYPLINQSCHFRFWPARQLWTICAVSLAAQTTTLPLSLYFFGAFSTWFLLSNLLLLPLVAPILILAMCTLALSFSPALAAVTTGPLNELLLFMAGITQSIEALPGSYPKHLWLCFPLLLLCYPLLVQLYRLLTRPRGINFLQTGGLLCMLIAGFTLQQYFKLSQQTLVLYQTRRGLLLESHSGGQVLSLRSAGLAPNDAEYAREGMLRRSLRHNNIQEMVLPPDSQLHLQILKQQNQRILLYNGTSRTTPILPDTLNIHILILNGNLQVDLERLLQYNNCKQIVAGPDCPPWLINAWSEKAQKAKTPFHAVRSQGAYILSKSSKTPPPIRP